MGTHVASGGCFLPLPPPALQVHVGNLMVVPRQSATTCARGMVIFYFALTAYNSIVDIAMARPVVVKSFSTVST